MAKFGIGQPVRRVEDQRFLTGQGRYVDDIVLPGMVHGVQRAVAACPRPASRRSTSSKAKAAPGVLLVLTGADVAADKIGAHDLASDAGGFRRAQGPPHLPAAAGVATASATSATASPSSSPRR